MINRSIKILLVTILITFSIILSSCTGGIIMNNWPGVSTDGEKVYIASGSNIFSVKASDGMMVWRYPEKSDSRRSFSAPPTAMGDQVVVADLTGSVNLISATNGSEINTLHANKGKIMGAPVATPNGLLIPSGDHNLYFVSMDGELQWKLATENSLWSSPAINEETGYLTSLDHNLYAFRLADGKEIWKVDLGGAAVASPALGEDGTVYLGTLTNEMLAIDPTSGKFIWRYKTGNAVWAQPLILDGILYFGDLSGNLYALDGKNGEPVWKRDAVSGPIIAQAAFIPDGIVFVTETGSILAMSTEGTKIWSQEIDGKLYNSPLVVGENIIVAVHQGENLLQAFNLNGAGQWTFAIPK